MDYSAVGKRIRSFRKKRGYTQAELAEILGYSIQHLSHIENGITKMSIDFVIALANALEVSLDELFKDDLTFLLSDTEEDNIAAVLKSCKSEEKESLKKILTIIQSDLNFYLDILE